MKAGLYKTILIL